MQRERQSGFSLIEVMFASLATMAVIVPALSFMLRAFDWYYELQSQVAINREARQVIDLLGNGAKLASAGKDGFAIVYGIRGSNKKPGGPQRANYILQYKNNNVTVSGDSFGTLSVTCSDVGLPLPDCAKGQTRNVSGWMGDDVSLVDDKRDVQSRTVEVVITITDPYEAQRLVDASKGTETYRTIFTLNRDEPDP